MSFEFLAADGTGAPPGATPRARSPIEWTHLEAGATLGDRAGWRVVERYGANDRDGSAARSAVGVADLSFLGKLELQADAGTASAIVAALAGGSTLALGHAVRHDGVWWCPITAERVLAVTPPESTASVRQALESAAAAARSPASVHELTTAFGSNAVVGPLARETFARTTALDLRPDRFPVSGFAPVSVARTPGMILRRGPDDFLHLFGSGYAQYVWTVFVDAARSLGGWPVGLAALGEEVGVGA